LDLIGLGVAGGRLRQTTGGGRRQSTADGGHDGFPAVSMERLGGLKLRVTECSLAESLGARQVNAWDRDLAGDA